MLVETVHAFERELNVYYREYKEPRIWTLPNGDPGYPGSHEIKIEEVQCNGEPYDAVLERAIRLGVLKDPYSEIENELFNKIS